MTNEKAIEILAERLELQQTEFPEIADCIYEIGNEVVEPRQTANPATEELIVRNELSHTGMNKGGGQ